MTKFQIGAQMFTVRDHCQTYEDMLETMKALKGMGYNTCQFSAHGSGITARQLRDILDKSGMSCCSTHIGMQDLDRDFDGVVEAHRLWGCEYPGSGGAQRDFETPETVRDLARRYSAYADRLEERGMHFVYHNHAMEMVNYGAGKNGVELLLQHCSPAVQFELDLFWVQKGGGNPIDYIYRFAGRMDVIHFKEMNGTIDNDNEMAPIGMGNMNWPEIMKACDEVGVKYALIEQDNAPDTDSLRCLRISHDNLAAMGGRF